MERFQVNLRSHYFNIIQTGFSCIAEAVQSTEIPTTKPNESPIPKTSPISQAVTSTHRQDLTFPSPATVSQFRTSEATASSSSFSEGNSEEDEQSIHLDSSHQKYLIENSFSVVGTFTV